MILSKLFKDNPARISNKKLISLCDNLGNLLFEEAILFKNLSHSMKQSLDRSEGVSSSTKIFILERLEVCSKLSEMKK